ncbi:MAG TPA: hypothetical protein VD861_18850 [Pyrinomonadaceae bacterium]|nr:hypothetical protein [Pyrinomonadaceae bacterium]
MLEVEFSLEERAVPRDGRRLAAYIFLTLFIYLAGAGLAALVFSGRS